LSDKDMSGVRPVRAARQAKSVSTSEIVEEVHDQGSTNQPWLAFKKVNGAPRPRINRGVGQTNRTKPQIGDKNSERIDTGQNEEAVTIDIAGEPVVIPDFERITEPQLKDGEIIQIPVQIQTTEPIIAQPKVDKRAQETAARRNADLKLFEASSEIFQNFQKSSKENSDRSSKSHKGWRSSGPNHVFEIFVPFDSAGAKEQQRNSEKKNIFNSPNVKVQDLASQTSVELKTLFDTSNAKKEQRNSQKKRTKTSPEPAVEDFSTTTNVELQTFFGSSNPKLEQKVNQKKRTKISPQEFAPNTQFELQTMFKFVADQKRNQNNPKQTFKVRKPKIKPTVESKEVEVKPCPNSLSECVDGCIAYEEIYAYSGCVVQCGESCG